jgi:catechol 2,3-dioxygenase-like lactoylglutathione lyase family enzyme
MNQLARITTAVALAATLTLAAGTIARAPAPANAPGEEAMKLGAFSVSLAVKDLAVSKAFYTKLGFAPVGGNEEHNWLVLQNGTTTIGLFQGMFEQNILTFCPGWTSSKGLVEGFQDVREIQKTLKSRGLTLTTEADESSRGPASLTLSDPDGNMILFDQHVDSPED